MPRSRAEAEVRYRRAERLEVNRERLAEASPGGSPARPIRITSAAVVETRTAALTCPHCRGEYRILEHTRPVPGLRRVDVACRRCSAPRALWFRLVPDEPN